MVSKFLLEYVPANVRSIEQIDGVIEDGRNFLEDGIARRRN